MKIGLLPLYIELYDTSVSFLHERLDKFYDEISSIFEEKDVEVIKSPYIFCRLENEFKEAVQLFETEKVDAIVTLHMAYSPSLESAKVLANTHLPIVVLDTTETFDFSPLQNSVEIHYCHGIHGVMDMCNLLKRNNKPYAICAGHYKETDVIDRAIGFVRAAIAANSLSGSKTGTIGGSFDGMGDFLVSDKEMKKLFGVDIVYSDKAELEKLIASVTDEEIEAEIKKDYETFTGEADKAVHAESTRVCLGVRKWIEKQSLSALTVNFLEISPKSGITIMPFMEAGKAMARGTGYAGEGDVLTASITGALLQGFKDTSFIEIFCPDWKNDTLFISHMGEMNLSLAMPKPFMKETTVIYGNPTGNPVVAYGCFKGGEAVFANVYRDVDGFKLLVSPVDMLEPAGEDNFKTSIHGWMKPCMPIDKFLEEISRHGVTHHSTLIYGATVEQIEFFGKLIGLSVVRVEA